MTDQSCRRVLTINAGSSSLKSALYEECPGKPPTQCLSADVSRVGWPGSRTQVKDYQGRVLLDEDGEVANHQAAIESLLKWISQQPDYKQFDAVGHRIVHGGRRFSEPQLVTTALTDALNGLVKLDPDHLPQAIAGLEVTTKFYPDLPQVACFDTAFHRQMPKVAQMYALPKEYFDEGVLRYGFHGLSYEYIVRELRALNGGSAGGRVVAAHLGNGASITAICDGKSVDTSMGFTPTEGLVMGTRSGDLDPGVLVYLSLEKKMSADEIDDLINTKSGLLGVSGTSEDVRDLLDKQATQPSAAEAIDLFCYRAKKYIGAYAAVLGGLDTLVFAGGIGEHSAPIRSRICDGLEPFGVRVDHERNNANEPLISADGSKIKIRVIKTNEDLIIASHTLEVIN